MSGGVARPASGWRGQEGGLHKGKVAGGPASAGCSQGGPRGSTDTCSPGNAAPSHLLPPQEKMPGPSNRGLLVASCPLSIHPLWLLNPRGWFLPTALISQASDTQLSSSLPHGPPSWLPLSFHAVHSASLPAPFLQEVFPDSPLTCL